MENFRFKVGESVWCPSVVGNGNPIEIIEVIVTGKQIGRAHV